MRLIVTGASGALGSAVVALATSSKHMVAGIDLHPSECLPAGAYEIIGSDLADPLAARSAFASAAGVMGGVDAVLHLAGGFSWSRVDQSDANLWRDLYRANVETSFNMVHAAIGQLAPGSSIVCVGAASAEPAGIGMAPYAAAKSGVARLVEALAQELRPAGIRVNAVLPSILDTPRNRAEMPGADPATWTTVDAVAEVLLFLAGKESRAINGALVPVTNNG